MKNTENGFDEMQKAYRNKVGNQTFFAMFFLFILDVGLQSFGIKFLTYPMNVMAIISVCMISYLFRTIKNNAYIPQGAARPKTSARKIISIICAVAFLAYLSYTVKSTGGNDAIIILVIVASIGLVKFGISAFTKKQVDKEDEQ